MVVEVEGERKSSVVELVDGPPPAAAVVVLLQVVDWWRRAAAERVDAAGTCSA
jgi:hypothetical protein